MIDPASVAPRGVGAEDMAAMRMQAKALAFQWFAARNYQADLAGFSWFLVRPEDLGLSADTMPGMRIRVAMTFEVGD